jgi:hypothetical protein
MSTAEGEEDLGVEDAELSSFGEGGAGGEVRFDGGQVLNCESHQQTILLLLNEKDSIKARCLCYD